MLAFSSRFVPSTKVVTAKGYDILSDSDKRAIASQLPDAMLQATEVKWREISSVITMFQGGAVLVHLCSGRQIAAY